MIEITMAQIFSKDNVGFALDRLLDKRDSCGPDGMPLSDLPDYWRINGGKITKEIIAGEYRPGEVHIIELINYKGKKRKIAIMNSVDRLILTAINIAIQTSCEQIMVPNNHAFRENMGVTSAVSQVCDYIEDGGHWVVNIDVEKYFDSIPISKMQSLIARSFSDPKLVALLQRYLTIKVEEEGHIKRKRKGIIQGSPISPILSNLFLTPLDYDFYARGMKYCRYSDDINIYFSTFEEAKACMEETCLLLEKEYGLRVNHKKSGVKKALEDVFLGYEFVMDPKSGNVNAVRERKGTDRVLNRWKRDGVRRVDRNYHLTSEGVLTRKDYTLLFESNNGKKYLPVETTDSITAYANITVSSDVFRFLNDKRVSLNLVDKYGESVGSFSGAKSNSRAKIMLKQAELYNDEKERLSMAKKMEVAAIHNMCSNLKYYGRRNKSEKIMAWVKDFDEIKRELDRGQDVTKLLMIEARCRQAYYSLFNEIIKDENYAFTQRTRRPPRDPLNAMISFGNTVLYNRIAMEIHKTALDIRIGIVHSTTNRSQTLNLDIADIFKPIIVDRTIFTLINRRVLDINRDFEDRPNGAVYLSQSGKRIFLGEFNNKLFQKVTEKGKSVTYDTKIKQEIQKIYRYFAYGEKYKPYKYLG